MKALILYKDWLLLDRGEIRPEIGDKLTNPYGSKLVSIQNIAEYNKWGFEQTFNNSLVEIDYNPNAIQELMLRNFELESEIGKLQNETIKFTEWIGENYHYIGDNEWEEFETTKFYETEELYKQFKKEQNGK